MAILLRARTGVVCYSQELARFGVPFYLAGDAGLTGQLEILDLLNLLRLVANPQDDLLALTHLRSPFVGLRDETLARIRLRNPRRPLLDQAEEFSRDGERFEAPEHAGVAGLERQSLKDGVALVRDLVALRSRIPLDQLARQALEESGYPMHLLLLPQPEPRLANLQRFLRVLADYRSHTVGSFLELWDRWEAQDLGIPQAPLYSKRDNVVTVSTIHGAKGLEWPVVFLVDLEGNPSDRMSNKFWSDKARGPVFAPAQGLRGKRTKELCGRRRAEETAEESRLFYVAATRARDRLILAGPTSGPKGRAEWASRGRNDAMTVTSVVPSVEIPPLPPEPSLSWLDRISGGFSDSPLALPLPAPRLRYTRSASELRTARRDRDEWSRVYRHGVIPGWRFARSGNGKDTIPADVRGNLIHGVLERIQEEDQITELLDVVVGALDSGDLEQRLASGSRYRDQLEEEIRKVVSSDEWRWYVEGENWRELWFVQFRTPRKWRVGAFDLYRPGEPGGVIVDFKTSNVDAAGARAEAEK
ncbi:MAG: 3'-5' exonuclease, partial [Gemmatimonadales bacterium]